MKPLTRRSVTTGLAAAVTAIPALGLPIGVVMAKGEPGQLAALIRRYWAEVDAFNADPAMEDDGLYFSEQPFDLTARQMIGVPARSADDALAAIELVIRDGEHSMIELDPDGSKWARLHTSLVTAVRDYLASINPAQA